MTSRIYNYGNINLSGARMEWDSGTFENYGTFTLANGSVARWGNTGHELVFTNTGNVNIDAGSSLSAQNLNWQNNGTLTNNGTVYLDTVNQAGGTVTNNSVMSINTLTGKNGSVVANNGTLTATGKIETGDLENSGTVNGMEIASDILNNTNILTATDITVANSLINEGDIRATGNVTAAEADNRNDMTVGGSAEISSLANSGTLSVNGTLESDTIVNSGTLSVNTLSGDNAVYTQTGEGTITTGTGWFTNSSINIDGGEIDLTAASDQIGGADGTLGQGNTYTISGGSVTVDTLDSASTVILTGGMLSADMINMTGQAVTVDGGTLKTTLGQIFDSSATSWGLEINAQLSSDMVSVDHYIVPGAGVGVVWDSVREGITFISGELALDNSYTKSIVTDATKVINDTYQTNGNVIVTFTGKLIGEG